MSGGQMKRLLVFFLALALVAPSFVKAEEPPIGMMPYPIDKEITDTTDLIGYALSKQNVTREDTHTSRETIDNLIKRSCSGIIAPHFVQCWEDPYYFPRFVKRVTTDLSRNWNDPRNGLGIYNILLSSEVRTGYLAGGFPAYIPTMQVDEKDPIGSALREMYKFEPLGGARMSTKSIIVLTIGSKEVLVNGQKKEMSVEAAIIKGSTFLPLRSLSEIFGFELVYNKPDIKLTKGNIVVEMTLGKPGYTVNGEKKTGSTSPTLYKGSVVVPVRMFTESIGITDVNYNAQTKQFTIGYDDIDTVIKKSVEQLKDVPLKLQKLVAEYMLSHLYAAKYQKLALRKLPKERFNDLYNLGRYQFLSDRDYRSKELVDMLNKTFPEDATQLQDDIAHDFDFNDLYYGGMPLVMSTIKMKQFLNEPRDEGKKDDQGRELLGPIMNITKYKFELETPFGLFAFNGGQDDNTYDGNKYFAIVDYNGNDTYTGPAGGTLPGRPAASIIDWKGSDKYTSTKDDPCSQGFGMLGYGFVTDHEGNDTYKSYDNSQGGCFFGIGLLWDESGNDSFSGRNMNQGAASFGVGNLVNIGGNDSYYCFQVGQAFGFSGGCGVLVDTDGDDKYVGEPGKSNPKDNLINPATGGHDNNRNYSFVQGAGWGRRGDMSDGHGWGGGVGVLVDVTGNDWYECGVYGQATGYWFGTGILNDLEGDDHYEGSFFVQSGTAHMGLTELVDDSGNDTYKVWKAISQGGAHDFSVSWFIDKEGNDNYLCYEEENGQKTSGGVLIGAAITNSLGLHVDMAGDDKYDLVNSSTLGYCLMRTGAVPDNYRYEEWTLGLMIDKGGNDTYTRTLEPNVPDGWPVPANNSVWREVTQPGNPAKSLGFGLDVEKGIVPEAQW